MFSETYQNQWFFRLKRWHGFTPRLARIFLSFRAYQANTVKALPIDLNNIGWPRLNRSG
ncbi:MAG: hypothetical protein ACJASL_003046 [Paraglaciecola sp.]|jgi:hypothetical protein